MGTLETKKQPLHLVHEAAVLLLTQKGYKETDTIIVTKAVELTGAEYGVLFTSMEGHLRPVYHSDDHKKSLNRTLTEIVHKAAEESKIRVWKFKEEGEERRAISIPLKLDQDDRMGLLILVCKGTDVLKKRLYEALDLYSAISAMALKKAHLYTRMKESLHSRDMFISMASHEIRTPLTTIHGYIQLLKKTTTDKMSEQAKWINQIFIESTRISRLINELLEINQIKSGQLRYNFHSHDLREIVSQSIANFKFNHPNREIIYKDSINEQNVQIIADFDKLLQVFNNILDNAAKYSPKETEITFNAQKHNSTYTLCIEDQGDGIDPKDIQHIFEGYYRGKNSSSTNGRGIGLLVAKRIVDKHHGELHILSPKKEGTMVCVTLPETVF